MLKQLNQQEYNNSILSLYRYSKVYKTKTQKDHFFLLNWTVCPKTIPWPRYVLTYCNTAEPVCFQASSELKCLGYKI